MTKVTYLGHSGFMVETENTCLIFDYYKGTLPQQEEGKKCIVFVSHKHYDHYSRQIFSLRGRFRDVTYVLSSDVPVDKADYGEDIVFLEPNREEEISGCRIRTLRSNDEGVAFLVTCEGRTFFHAGDLNWWHWEGESKDYLVMMRRSYQSEINKLQGTPINAAFIPVDPRLADYYCLGLDCFMKRAGAEHVFPMHFWGNYQVFDRLMLEECTEDYRDKIVRIEKENQSFFI